ncbi:MAG: hypothetical protein HQL77_15925 [Magnetococcales bacterium]|nr:hypothetical protein [Magnetococcales bacterium]
MNISMNGMSFGMNAMQRMGGGRPMGAPPSADKIIAKEDKDGDGKLGVDEVKGKLKDEFSKVDTDQDGKLDAKELDTALKVIRNKVGSMPRPPQGGDQDALNPSQNPLGSDMASSASGSNTLSTGASPLTARLYSHLLKNWSANDESVSHSGTNLIA